MGPATKRMLKASHIPTILQYQYLPNETYEAHCDCTDDENSFGLSVWTEKGAKSYNNTGLIVKVKIKYEDVGRLVHNSNKIRCSKIEILE
jgi:hypothetical protein